MNTVNPDQRYFNIIRRIEIAENGEVTFYFTGTEHSFTSNDFIAGTENHKRLFAIEAAVKSHNSAETKRYRRSRNS